MAMVLPRVSISETQLTSTSADDPVTMPLFIAYTDSAVRTTVMQPVSVASQAQATTLFGSSGTLAYALRHFFDNQGQRCYVLSLGSNAQWSDNAGRLQALIAALQTTQLIEAVAADNLTGLLLAPEMGELNDVAAADRSPASDNNVMVTAFDAATLWYQGWQALLQLCQRGQRFALLELPDEPAQANALGTKSFSADLCQNAAAWWPRLQTSYVDNDQSTSAWRVLSPLPAVAAAIQRSASESGIWKAPANIQLAKVIRPVRNIVQSQVLFNQQGVSGNLIRSFAGKGVRLWGCRTLLNDSSSPWRYIQLRLLVNSVETQLSKLARAFMFEPNNAQTWTKVKGQVWTWLRQQWLAGAFFGTVEEEAFTLSIGLDESMSADDIAAGKMILNLQLALLAPAEFIDISLTLDMRDGSAITQDGS